MHKIPAFYLLTDAHYVSPQIWTEGEPINRRERGDQIALKATPQILDTFLEKVLADTQTDTVIFTGDNVNGGDTASHEEFRQRLETLKAAGKNVCVIAATHDYCGAGDDENTFMACRYTADGTEPTPFLRKAELTDFYYDYGPRQSLSLHRESGSYVVQLGDGVRLIMIADNGNGRSHCGLFADGMQWLEAELKSADAAGDFVLLATHHPVLPPWDVFRHMAEHELYGGCRALWDLMCRYNVRVVFTGHTHLQNIRKYTDGDGRFFYDVSTIALANAAGKMRKVTVDVTAGECRVVSIGIDMLHGIDTGGKSAYAYLHPLNFPGILETLLPLGAKDYDTFLRLADGFLPTDKLARHRHLIGFVCRRLLKMRLSSAVRLGGARRKLTREQRWYARQTKLAEVIFTILRHIYPGNPPYTPDTAEYIAATAISARLDKLVRLFRIRKVQAVIPEGSSLTGILRDFLYNTRTGDDDAICIPLQKE